MYEPKKTLQLQTVLVSFLVAIITILLGYKSINDLHKTIFLLLVVSFSGIYFVNKISIYLNNNRLLFLGYIWIIKIALTFLVLFVGWMPELNTPLMTGTGFDPQRYYHQAIWLVDDKFEGYRFLGLGQYYLGVLYYYAVIMILFGSNPVAPALFNIFFTFLTTLYLIKFLSYYAISYNEKYWIFGLFILFPEVLWYDVMTGRDVTIMCFITLAVIGYSNICINSKTKRYDYIIFLVSIVIIAFTRTPVVLLIVVSILVVGFVNRNIFIKSVVLSAIILLFGFIGLTLNQMLGSSEFTLDRIYGGIIGQDTLGYTWEWSERSLGSLLVPKNVFESILFVIPRALLYVASPIPNIKFSFSYMINGSVSDWSLFLRTISAIFYVIFVPVSFSSLFCYVKNWQGCREKYSFIVLPTFIIFMGTIASTNIVHDRYRVMTTLLFLASVWLGSKSPKQLIRKLYVFWAVVMSSLSAFYILYKLG